MKCDYCEEDRELRQIRLNTRRFLFCDACKDLFFGGPNWTPEMFLFAKAAPGRDFFWKYPEEVSK
jgi:hypothetical protein